MHMEIMVDGKTFRGLATTDKVKFDEAKEFMKRSVNMSHLSIELDSGDTLFLPEEKIQKCIFLFIGQDSSLLKKIDIIRYFTSDSANGEEDTLEFENILLSDEFGEDVSSELREALIIWAKAESGPDAGLAHIKIKELLDGI